MDWTTSTPDVDSDIGKWSERTSDKEDPMSDGAAIPSSNSSSAPSDDSQASTGLGIHATNFTRLKVIGIPVFKMPGFAKVVKEANVLKQAMEAAEGAQEWKLQEKERLKRETLQRQWTKEEGIRAGLFESSEVDHEITGEPCTTCGKILCYCDFQKEEEEMRKRGYEDPFERIKDRHIMQPGQDVLPSSSTPEEDIEFWNKCKVHEAYESESEENIERVDASNMMETAKSLGFKHFETTAEEKRQEKKDAEKREARGKQVRQRELARRAMGGDDDDGWRSGSGSGPDDDDDDGGSGGFRSGSPGGDQADDRRHRHRPHAHDDDDHGPRTTQTGKKASKHDQHHRDHGHGHQHERDHAHGHACDHAHDLEHGHEHEHVHAHGRDLGKNPKATAKQALRDHDRHSELRQQKGPASQRARHASSSDEGDEDVNSDSLQGAEVLERELQLTPLPQKRKAKGGRIGGADLLEQELQQVGGDPKRRAGAGGGGTEERGGKVRDSPGGGRAPRDSDEGDEAGSSEGSGSSEDGGSEAWGELEKDPRLARVGGDSDQGELAQEREDWKKALLGGSSSDDEDKGRRRKGGGGGGREGGGGGGRAEGGRGSEGGGNKIRSVSSDALSEEEPRWGREERGAGTKRTHAAPPPAEQRRSEGGGRPSSRKQGAHAAPQARRAAAVAQPPARERHAAKPPPRDIAKGQGGARLDLESESSMDVEEFRHKHREERREAQIREMEIEGVRKEKKVYFSKDDKKGVTVSIDEPPEWVRNFLGKENRRRQPPSKTKPEEDEGGEFDL